MPKDYNVFQMLIAALCCFYHRRSIIRVKVGALFQLGVLVSNLSVCFYTVVGYSVSHKEHLYNSLLSQREA